MQQSTLADARVRHITDPTSNPDHTSLAQENAKAAAVAELSASAEAALQRDLERAVRNLELEVRAREALEATLEASAEDRARADRSLDHAAEEISNLQAEVSNVRSGLASREQELARRYQVCALSTWGSNTHNHVNTISICYCSDSKFCSRGGVRDDVIP